MEKIRNTFSKKYKKWEVQLPKEIKDFGEINKNGWSIRYVLEIRENEKVLHVSSSHRMTSPGAYTIDQNGEIENLPAGISGFTYNSEIPGDKELKQEIFYAKNRKVGATHRLIGIGRNLKTTDLTTIILFREYKHEFSFSNEKEIFHPNYPSTIKFNQIKFRSLSHFFHYWKSKYTNEFERADRIISDDRIEVDFVKGIRKKKSIFKLFSSIDYETNQSNKEWEENKLRILLWGSILKFEQNPELGNEMLKYNEKRFIFENPVKYWGNRENVLGYVLTHTCFDLFYLKWKEPGDNNR